MNLYCPKGRNLVGVGIPQGYKGVKSVRFCIKLPHSRMKGECSKLYLIIEIKVESDH
jgi:hypothetical protein